jgi:hypothetical protein
MRARIRVITELGEFRGDIVEMSQSEYDGLCTLSKDFYKSGGFEMVTEDGGQVILPPSIIVKSILKIDIVE